jgi:leader peptidase (prepilin peptidase) / N-methyltransferase
MIYFVITFFIFGLFFGSFLNVLVDRLSKGENPWIGRSHCDYCKQNLRWFELVPLFSYLIQGGKCRRCHKKLSWQYPIMEIVTGLVFVLAFINGNDNFYLIISNLIVYSAFLVIFVADLKSEIIIDSMLAVAIYGIIIRLASSLTFFVQWLPYIYSAGGAGLLFLTLWLVTRGRGMGFGDVKLSLILGFFAGFPNIVYALYIAFLTGAVLGVILVIVGKKKLKSHVPFGPFLIGGTIIAIQYGSIISSWLKGIIW